MLRPVSVSVARVKIPMRIGRIKPGDSVEIEKASLGSYWVRFNGRNGVKGRRVQ